MDATFARARTWAEVDLDALCANFKTAVDLAGPDVLVGAVLKANAYGHGAVPVARALYKQGLKLALVACLSEALELKRALPQLDVLVMGYTPQTSFAYALDAGIALTVVSTDQARQLSDAAKGMGKTAVMHIKLDTGFHRLGMAPTQQTIESICEMAQLPGIKLQGLFTHLALTDLPHDQQQMQRFNFVAEGLAQAGISIPYLHVCDSIGLVRYPQWRLQLVRAGAFLYGVRPSNWNDPIPLPPTLTLKTRIAQIHEIAAGEGVGYDALFVAQRPTRIAALPVGYGDGVPRRMTNTAYVGLHGQRAKVVGLVCMDQLMIDITDIPQAQTGDIVTVLGGTDENAIPYMDYADWAKTNRNEAISIISRRVPRVYIKNGGIDSIDDPILGGE